MRVESNKLYEKTPFCYNRVVQSLVQEKKVFRMANKSNDLAHTKWMRCIDMAVIMKSVKVIPVVTCQQKKNGIQLLSSYTMQ